MMDIKILNKGNRNLLICTRNNGTIEKAEIGPNIPFHDLAHFIVEKHLGLKHGFYGNIYNGYTVKELSDKEIIKTLPVESVVSEIATRALQSIWSGACSIEQFNSLIEAEFKNLSINFRLNLTEEEVFQMYSQYDELITQWKQLKEGESIEVRLTIKP
ncbi:MAG: hypothetical protein JNK73_03410 [Bacteroidia bacterium]|nr:hypothetical protein [Bacteroidia bacterium]